MGWKVGENKEYVVDMVAVIIWHHELIVDVKNDLLVAFAEIQSNFLQMQLAHYPIYLKQGKYASPTLFMHYPKTKNWHEEAD